MALELGDAALGFSLKGSLESEDTEVSLSDFRGKKQIVIFYTLDFSPVCSVQIPDYNGRIEKICAKGAEVVAINRDSTFAHKVWSQHLGGIQFPLLADNLEVSKKFGGAGRDRHHHPQCLSDRQQQQSGVQARGGCRPGQHPGSRPNSE